MLGDRSRMVWTLASRAGGIDRPISRSASVLARPKAVAARRRPINSAAIASAFARPANWWSRSPAAASNADQCGDVLDDDRPQRRVTRVPEEGCGRLAPLSSLPSRLGEALEQRDPVGREGDRQNDPSDEISLDSSAGEELADGESDRHAAADQERGDRRDECPQESCTPVAERVPGIRRAAPVPQRHPEKHLVDGVRGRVSGLRKEGCGSRRQPSGELRGGDDEVGQQRDRDAAFISPALAGSDRRERAPR